MNQATPETVTAPAIDKSTWGEGPWQDEPDRVDWVAHGFACFALRNPSHGYWCCYVGIPVEHPLYGRHWTDDDRFRALAVHMGVNYTALCDDYICHVPAPGMPWDVWWVGCDFGHFRDRAPASEARLRELVASLPEDRARALARSPFENSFEVYRALPYVRRECERLAEQLAAIA